MPWGVTVAVSSPLTDAMEMVKQPRWRRFFERQTNKTKTKVEGDEQKQCALNLCCKF